MALFCRCNFKLPLTVKEPKPKAQRSNQEKKGEKSQKKNKSREISSKNRWYILIFFSIEYIIIYYKDYPRFLSSVLSSL